MSSNNESTGQYVVHWAQVIVPVIMLVGAGYYVDRLNTAVLANEIKHGFEVMSSIQQDVKDVGDKVSLLERNQVVLEATMGQAADKLESDFGWIAKRFDRIEARLPNGE